MKTTYTLTGNNTPGEIEIEFFKGVLNAFKIEFKEPITEKQYAALLNAMPYREANINDFYQLGLTITRKLADNEKIKVFCSLYEQFYGIKYNVSAADSGKIKRIKLTEEIANHYFASQNFLFKGKHSISNLVKYWNELRAEIAMQNKSKHPDVWSKEYEAKLKPSEIPEYWRHLRSLGWEVVKNQVGDTVTWIKREN